MSAEANSSSSVGQSTESGVFSKDPEGWFMEINSQWKGIACSLKVKKVLFDQKSKYQHIIVFETEDFGNVLVLDGVIQLTSRDEHSYQEMIAHLPLFSHPNPENVLVIGGGDGGVIREIVKHPSVKKVTICEIDEMVIDCGKKYFPTVAAAWDDKRVTKFVGDGNEFMARAENEGAFDVIITDSSDPVGPAQALFESPFYQAMARALKPGGKVCTQAECYWKDLDLIAKLVRESLHIYDAVEYASTQTPTYPFGQIGFLLCSKAAGTGRKAKNISCASPARYPDDEEREKFRYYTSELHKAAFVLPKFAEDKILEAVDQAKEEKDKAKQQTAKAAAKPKKAASKKGGKGGKRKAEEEAENEESSSAAKDQKTEKEESTEDKDKEVKDTEITDASA